MVLQTWGSVLYLLCPFFFLLLFYCISYSILYLSIITSFDLHTFESAIFFLFGLSIRYLKVKLILP